MDYFLDNNGKLLKDNEQIYSLNSRIVKYGDGFFETMRVFEGNIPFIGLHWERIIKAKNVLRINLPIEWDFNYFQNQINYLIKQSGYSNARIRLQIYREAEGFYYPENSITNWFAIISEIKSSLYELGTYGIKLVINPEIKNSNDILTEVKSTNSLRYILAAMYGKEHNANDSIILNHRGNICETSNSNIFMIHNNILYTPPFVKNCLDGIMRKKIIGIASKLKIEVSVQEISVEKLLSAEEVFICNTIQGIQWVQEIDGKIFYNKEIAERIIQVLNKELKPL
jgi:branched-chain amino acid aminotransferase